MQRPNPLSPDLMSTRERLDELCAILALGLVRLRMRDRDETSRAETGSRLHFAPDRSGHAPPTHRRDA